MLGFELSLSFTLEHLVGHDEKRASFSTFGLPEVTRLAAPLFPTDKGLGESCNNFIAWVALGDAPYDLSRLSQFAQLERANPLINPLERMRPPTHSVTVSSFC